MNAFEHQLLAAIREQPLATQQQLADMLGISRESVAAYISRLTRAGHILGKGYLLPERKHIAVLGGANVDITGKSTASLLAGDSNPGTVVQSAGGVGRNIAENLARLGHEVSLISLIGQDANGDWLLQRMQQAGIRTQAVLRDASLPTSTYLALNNDAGELLAAISAMQIANALTPERLSGVQSQLVAADILIVEANIPETTLSWLASLPLRGTLYADAVSATKAPRLRPLLSKLAGLKVNISEARALVGQPNLSASDAAAKLLECGVQQIILSQGADGLAIVDSNGEVSQPSYPVSLVSDTGAGDALLAGIIHTHLKQCSPGEQLAFALACAALTLASEHANSPQLTEQKVMEWIAQH